MTIILFATIVVTIGVAVLPERYLITANDRARLQMLRRAVEITYTVDRRI